VCLCLWDPRGQFDPEDGKCLESAVCCWNMPCEKYDGTTPFECGRGGGSVDDGGVTPKNCSWSTASAECRCTPPLVNAG